MPLRVGTFVSARIDGREAADLIRVPRHALQPGNRIWVVTEEETIEPRHVDIARRDEAWVWIADGLKSGARVSITSISNPVAGTPVRVTEDLDRTRISGADR